MQRVPWFGPLALSGLFAGAQKIAEGIATGTQIDPAAAIPAILAGVAGSYLINRANSARDAQVNATERQALATRNHHLRRGMAAALRRGLNQARRDIPDLPADPYHALFASWDCTLQLAETNEADLERFFPAKLAESQWDVTTSYHPNLDEDAQALAGLLQDLTDADQIYPHWTEDQALHFARQVLPFYRQAFADDLAGDSAGVLFQAFTVKGVNQIRAMLRELLDLMQPRPMDLGRVRAWSLPIPTRYFVGREEFLAKLHVALQEKRKALVCAAGGYGKTQAALEYVRRFGGHYEDVVWVRASDGAALFESYRQVAAGTGRLAQRDPSEADVQRAVKSWLAEHPNVLLVFDNLDDPEIAKAYWPTGDPQPFVLATSQKREVSELERMHPVRLDVWEPQEALKFLIARIAPADMHKAERAAAAKFAEETGYLPLALEQAGAYIAETHVSFAEYLRTYMRVRLSLLEKQKRIAGDYRRSVATTWKASMERMPEAARELLSAASHLAPHGNPFELVTCSPEALGPVLQTALTDETEPDPLAALLSRLQLYSLVRVDRETRTFSMHRLLQEVVREQQGETERQEWMGRWVTAFRRFLPDDAEHRESPPHSRGWAAFEALFLRMGEEHAAIVDAARLAHRYVYHFLHRGRWRDAELLGVRAMQVFERVLGPEHPDTLISVNNLAGLYDSQGRYAEAEPLYQRALAASERVLGPEHPSTLISVNNLAGLYESQGRYAEAEPLYQRTLGACERVLGLEHPNTLSSVNNLAGLYRSQGRYAEAEPLYQRALAARERVLGPEHPSTLISVNNLAELYENQGRYAEAEPLYRRALAARERVLGPEHPSTLTSVNNLAELYESQGRYAEAEPLYLRALAARERVLGLEHPDTLGSVNNLAGLYQSQGRYAEAEPLYLRALAACERVLGPEHPYTLSSVNNLAALYESQGRYAEAEPLYQRALSGMERVLGSEHPHTKTVRENLRLLRLRMGRGGGHA